MFDEADQRVAELEAELRAVRVEFETFRDRVRELEREASGGGPERHPHSLARLAAMTPDERAGALGDEERATLRAVQIYEAWADVTWQFGDTDTTANAKHSPAKVGIELRRAFGEDLSWTQMYRVMRAVMELSGGTYHVNDYDREDVAGGELEYHERPAPGGRDTKKETWSVASRRISLPTV